MTSQNIIMIAWAMDEFGLWDWWAVYADIDACCFGIRDKIQRRYCRKFWEIRYDYDYSM